VAINGQPKLEGLWFWFWFWNGQDGGIASLRGRVPQRCNVKDDLLARRQMLYTHCKLCDAAGAPQDGIYS
jgi:hypothetical protein